MSVIKFVFYIIGGLFLALFSFGFIYTSYDLFLNGVSADNYDQMMHYAVFFTIILFVLIIKKLLRKGAG